MLELKYVLGVAQILVQTLLTLILRLLVPDAVNLWGAMRGIATDADFRW